MGVVQAPGPVPVPTSRYNQNLRVYITNDSGATWQRLFNLAPFENNPGAGVNTSSAVMRVVNQNMDINDPNNLVDMKDRQFLAINKFGLDIGKRAPGTHHLFNKNFFYKITEADEIDERTIFMGFPFAIGFNVDSSGQKSEHVTFAGIDELLDHQGIMGAYALNDNGDAKFFTNVPPIFNEDDLGNMSDGTHNPDGGVNPIKVFDYMKIGNTADTTNRWTVLDIVNYVFYQFKYGSYNFGGDVFDPYKFRWMISQQDEIAYLDNPTRVNFEGDNAAKGIVQDFELIGKSIWGVLVELVEAVGDYSITVNYQGDEPVLTIYQTGA